jgi:sporulation protein YlmC with PRC-barrel domain
MINQLLNQENSMRTKSITTAVLTVLFGLSGTLLAGTAFTQEAKPDATQIPTMQQSQTGVVQDQETQAGAQSDSLAEDDTMTPETDVAEDDTMTPETDVAEDDTMTPDTDMAADEPGAVTPSVGTSAEPFTDTVLDGMTTDQLVGMDVVDSDGESVGSVSDLLIGADNTIDRAVIDVGGFLGFGAKSVAIGMDRLSFAEGDDKIMLAATREELDAMPEWERSDQGWMMGN